MFEALQRKASKNATFLSFPGPNLTVSTVHRPTTVPLSRWKHKYCISFKSICESKNVRKKALDTNHQEIRDRADTSYISGTSPAPLSCAVNHRAYLRIYVTERRPKSPRKVSQTYQADLLCLQKGPPVITLAIFLTRPSHLPPGVHYRELDFCTYQCR